MAVFNTPEDIANRAIQHLGLPRIVSLTDSSRQAIESLFCYDKLRRAELRRSAWTFAARRAVLRARTATTFRMTPLAWAVGTTYAAAVIVKDSLGYLWISTRAGNIANTPGTSGDNPAWVPYYGPMEGDVWASGAFYPGDIVYKTGSPAKAYIAVLPAAAQDPASGSPWQEVTGATVAALVGFDPKGYSPDASVLRKLYGLPANFMRIAPQDVKTAGTPRQTITAGQQYNDWEIEGGVLATAMTGPIIFRFIADTTDVPKMDGMFCEGLAARMAAAMCETLTGSTEKLGALEAEYSRWIGVARAVNAIEAGSTEGEAMPAPAQQAAPAGRGR